MAAKQAMPNVATESGKRFLEVAKRVGPMKESWVKRVRNDISLAWYSAGHPDFIRDAFEE